MAFEKILRVTALEDDYRAAGTLMRQWEDTAPDHVDFEEITGFHIVRGEGGGLPVVAAHLTDDERKALSYAYFDKQFVIKTYEDQAGKTVDGVHIISGWDDVTPSYDVARQASLMTAMLSLNRFGLVESYYERSTTPSRERVIGRDNEGRMKLPDTGWRYKINDKGLAVLAQNRAFHYKCCDGCVVLNCVCSEKTFCAEHGGGCHGTHD